MNTTSRDINTPDFSACGPRILYMHEQFNFSSYLELFKILKNGNLERVEILMNIAQHWSKCSSIKPLGINIKQKNYKGISLFEMLCEDEIPVEDVKALIAVIFRREEEGRQTKSLYEMRRDKKEKES